MATAVQQEKFNALIERLATVRSAFLAKYAAALLRDVGADEEILELVTTTLLLRWKNLLGYMMLTDGVLRFYGSAKTGPSLLPHEVSAMRVPLADLVSGKGAGVAHHRFDVEIGGDSKMLLLTSNFKAHKLRFAEVQPHSAVKVMSAFVKDRDRYRATALGPVASGTKHAPLLASEPESESEPVVEDRVAAGPAEPSADVLGQIEKLGQLHASGILTDDEFETKKQQLLGRL
jgi:hypothetical protein